MAMTHVADAHFVLVAKHRYCRPAFAALGADGVAALPAMVLQCKAFLFEAYKAGV